MACPSAECRRAVRASHCPRRKAGARTFLGSPQTLTAPSVAHRCRRGFLKPSMLLYLPKVLAQAGFPPARPSCSHRGAGSGVEGVSQLSPGGQGQSRPHCGGSAPSWGPRGAPAQWQQGPALLSQEGTFSFGVPKKNCRARSARSAKQKSRRRTWAMTKANCGAGSAGESGAQTGPGCVRTCMAAGSSPPQGCPRAQTGC